MNRRATVRSATALTALTALVTACSPAAEPETISSPPSSAPPGTASPQDDGAGVVDLRTIAAGRALAPATYAVPFVGEEGPARALVDVPAGYFSAGGWVIDDGDGALAPDEFGDLAFLAGDLGDIETRPCRHGHLARTGPGIGDLVRALVMAARGRSTRPRRVSVGGRVGQYLTITAPTDLYPCGGAFRLFRGPDGGWYGADLPGTRIHLWILDVDGKRVVAAARTVPHHTSHPAELVRMAAGAEFVPDLRQVPTRFADRR